MRKLQARLLFKAHLFKISEDKLKSDGYTRCSTNLSIPYDFFHSKCRIMKLSHFVLSIVSYVIKHVSVNYSYGETSRRGIPDSFKSKPRWQSITAFQRS